MLASKKVLSALSFALSAVVENATARGSDITHLVTSLQPIRASPLCRCANLGGIVGDSEPSPQISYSHHTRTNTQHADFSCPATCLCKTMSSGPQALCLAPFSPKDAKNITFSENGLN